MMSLNNITRHIILDVSVNKHIVVLVKQYDIEIREIIVKITDNGTGIEKDEKMALELLSQAEKEKTSKVATIKTKIFFPDNIPLGQIEAMCLHSRIVPFLLLLYYMRPTPLSYPIRRTKKGDFCP